MLNESSRLQPARPGDTPGSGYGGMQPAGRRPQVCPSWMTKDEFEVCRNDPYRAFDAAQNRIAELQQRVTVQKKLNAALLQDPQYQFGQAVQNFEKLKQEHIQLNDAYNDLEAVNETLQEVVEVLRGDKHQYLVELNSIKRESAIQSIENQQLEFKSRQLRAFNDSLDLKLKSQEAQLASLEDDVKEAGRQYVEMSSELSALEATAQNLSLQSSSLSDLRQHLDTTRVSQDRAIQALEREVQGKAQEIVQHDTQLWEFKREMSGRILALQKKAQECNDELGRLQRLSEHEINTLAAQNRALNDELKSTADALFATRREKTDFATAAKKEIHQRKEEIQQCLSVLDLVERQNSGLEASIMRMMEQNKLSEKQIGEKDNINNKNLIEQANFIAMIHMELQSTREDLYILKARLCHHCRETILADEIEEERRMAMLQPAAAVGQGASSMGGGGRPLTSTMTSGAGGAGASGLSRLPHNTVETIGPMEFDASGAPMVSGGQTDAERAQLSDELKRAKEALKALNHQLLEERALREKERREEEELRRQEEEDRIARQLEDDAKRRRAKDDERKLAAGEEAQTYTIRFVDGTRKKIDAFRSDTIGELVSRVAAKVGIRQTEFFHLAQSVNENSVLGAVDRFLDRNKTLEQESITPKCNLVFKMKHYKRHRRWTDTIAQEWMFRQIHQNIVEEYYPVHEKLAVELASFEIQAVFGDYSGKKRHSYFDRVGLDSYLPVSVSAHEYEYWQERLYQLHKKRKGMSTIDARTSYIDTFAAKSPYWGLTFFDIRDRENRPFLAGIGEDGMYILSASRREILATLRFDQLLGWERSATGIFVKKRGSTKMTLYASSKLQSKEMVDLLSEYYMMLPQDTRDRLGIAVDQQEELRARLPPAEMFENAIVNRKRPVEYYSRLEYMKYTYMEHCLHQDEAGTRRRPITKLTQMIDRALDEDRKLEDLDLADCDPPLDDWQWAVIHELLHHTLDQYTPQDTDQWLENINIKRVSFAHDRDKQLLTEHCIPNVCNFIRKFTELTFVNLSYIPLDNRNEGDVSAALLQLPQLHTLILKGCKIGHKGFISIVYLITKPEPSLRVLDLEHNLLTHSSVSLICGAMDNDSCRLTDLNLGFNRIEIVGLESLMATLRRKKCLLSFDFSGNPGGRGATSKFADLIAAAVGIRDLAIASSSITGDAGVRISAELKGRGELRKLNMSDNPIGPTLTRQRQVSSGEISRDYPAEFFSFLDVGSYCNLTELVMDRCQLHEDAGQALASMLHNNTKLTDLIVTNNQLATKTGFLAPAWTDMLPINQYITKLHLSYNGIQYPGLMKLFAAMMRNRSIVELRLDGNKMDRYPPNTPHVEIVTFFENNTTLQELHMCDMLFKDDVLVKMGEGLRRNRGLKKIVAHNNDLTVRGVGEFSRHMPENTTLQYLDLSCRSVQINDEVYLQAYKALIEASNLETVLL